MRLCYVELCVYFINKYEDLLKTNKKKPRVFDDKVRN